MAPYSIPCANGNSFLLGLTAMCGRVLLEGAVALPAGNRVFDTYPGERGL